MKRAGVVRSESRQSKSQISSRALSANADALRSKESSNSVVSVAQPSRKNSSITRSHKNSTITVSSRKSHDSSKQSVKKLNGKTAQANAGKKEESEESEIDELRELQMRAGFVKTKAPSIKMPSLKTSDQKR